MTATDVTTAAHTAAHGHDAAELDAVASWLSTTEHTRIGRLYAGFSILGVVGALVLAVLLGIERIDPAGAAIVSLGSVSQLFAAYRWLLVLVGVLPLAIGVAIAVVPHLVGADSIAFPRAAAASFWGWLFGSAAFVGATIANGGPSGIHPDAVQLWNVAVVLVAVSLTVASVCVATTVVALRRPGLRLNQVPLFAWAMLVFSSVLLLALPVLAAIEVLVFADFRFIDQAFGGAGQLERFVGWMTGQPQVLVLALPALAVLAEVLGAGTSARSRTARLGALAVVGAVSFGPWAQSFFTPGVATQGWFGFVAIVAPLAVLAFLGATAAKPVSNASFPLAIGGVLMVTLGAVLGALRPWKGLELNGTTFGDGYTALVVLGGLLGLLAALVHWGPMLWGSGPVPAPKAMGLGALGTIGTFLAGAPLVVAGLQKQPTNAVNFDVKSATKALNIVSFAGYALVLVTVLAAAGLLASTFRNRSPHAA